MEDFTKLRLLAKKMNRTAYKRGWQFRIEIDSPLGTPPEDFDIYAKDITYDPITIEIEPEKLGGHTFNWPTGAGTTTITMTMRYAHLAPNADKVSLVALLDRVNGVGQ